MQGRHVFHNNEARVGFTPASSIDVTKIQGKCEGKKVAEACSTKFDEVQPYLEYIELFIHGLLGDVREQIPHAWKQGIISEFLYWTQNNILSVQEAVILLLNYYRYVMEEYMFRCRNKCTSSCNENNIQAEIITMINNLEIAVCKNECYQLRAGVSHSLFDQHQNTTESYCQSGDLSNMSSTNTVPNCNYYENMNSADTNTNMENVERVDMNSATKKSSTSISDNENIPNDDILLSESINEEIEEEFLENIIEDCNAICNGDLNVEDTLLLMCNDVDQDVEKRQNLEQKYEEYKEENMHKGNEQKYKVSAATNIPLQQHNGQSETIIFGNMIKKKCCEMAFCLTNSQREIVKRSIVHYQDLIAMGSISAVKAYEFIECVMEHLVCK